MNRLPQQLPMEQLMTKWAAMINPILASPIVNGQMLEDITLITGTTVINHKLGRDLQGWFLVRIDGAATVYDNQATNQMSKLTLSLTSNATVHVSIWVF